MTYKLEPWLDKISSTLIVLLPDGTSKRYINGQAAVNDVYNEHYVIKHINAVGGEIILSMEEVTPLDAKWIGEERVFF